MSWLLTLCIPVAMICGQARAILVLFGGISMDSHYDTSESAAAARRSSRSTSLTRPCGISPSCITPSGCSPFCFLIPRRRRRFLLNWAGEQSCVHRCSRAEFVIFCLFYMLGVYSHVADISGTENPLPSSALGLFWQQGYGFLQPPHEWDNPGNFCTDICCM